MFGAISTIGSLPDPVLDEDGDDSDWDSDEPREHWHAVGRLDADTTGLLLMTNDGALVHHATQPGSKLPKAYHALCKGLLRDEQIDALRHGVELTGGLGISAPAEVDVLRYETATTWLGITISEGKNRQIRRSLHRVRSGVMRLERVAIGDVRLGTLREGEWRRWRGRLHRNLP